MRVFIMGGTGFIGAAILRALIGRGHEVLALVRSDRSFGASVLHGDIRSPGAWVPGMPPIDAVMHAACDFDDAMAETDRLLLDRLLPHLSSQPNKSRFLYTGGNWLFGATGGTIATEETNFAPLPAFAWMVQHSERVLESDAVEGSKPRHGQAISVPPSKGCRSDGSPAPSPAASGQRTPSRRSFPTTSLPKSSVNGRAATQWIRG